ncbi:MAG: acetamidase/formamidase family protein, partial [Rhodospirillaceae bacterium]|nr:acetamidase/formamidase family protein [Rhodospirillaceae bacterium]
LDFTVDAKGSRLRLTALFDKIPVGNLELARKGDGYAGGGVMFGTKVTATMQRPPAKPSREPRTLSYDPTQYHPLTSAAPNPVLHLVSGDIVRTQTIDPYGQDEHDVPSSMPGNPGTGPFHVEGALPGDTVAIKLLKVRTNRPTARMFLTLDPATMVPGTVQKPGVMTDYIWSLDPSTNSAAPRSPSEKLKNFRVQMRPMLGVISVALSGGQAVPNRELGEWGGNMDYAEMREGVTLYLPVWHTGALIFLGDAHARQAHGEVAGQGLETSMDVEFQVTLIKNQILTQPWAENADYVMVSGIAGSMQGALQRATTGLSTWLKRTYQLDDSEVAVVLGSSLEYDVAEVVSAKFHIVAKVRKDVLALIAPVARAETGK